MSRYLLLILISTICGSTALLAQDKVAVGQSYQVIDANAKHYLTHKGEILALKILKRSIILQKMNAGSLEFQKTRMYDDFPIDYQVEKITRFKNRFYLFYSLWENEKEQLYARQIDVTMCELMPPKKIVTIDGKIVGDLVKTGTFRVATANKFHFFFSYDSTSMAVQYRLKPEKRDDSKSFDMIGMHVFTSDLTEKWGGKVKMPYTQKKMDNLTYSLDSKGNAYIVTRVYNDDSTDQKKRSETEANYSLEILTLAAGSAQASSTKVKVADKFVKTIWLYENPQGGMICAGYYNIGKRHANADGVLMFKFDGNGKLSGLNTYEIPIEILNQYTSGKSRRKNERKEGDDEAEATNMELKNIYIHNDGGIVLVGEQYYIKSHSTYSYGQHKTYLSYHYDDILITKIDPAGKLAWMRKLPKRQISDASGEGMSYAHINGKKAHYFVFLDNEENKDLALSEVPSSQVGNQEGFVTAYRVDNKEGDVKKLPLLNTRNINGMEIYEFSPDRIVATSQRTFIFEAYKKKKRKKQDVLVKVDLGE
jgi:hypothetical protein